MKNLKNTILIVLLVGLSLAMNSQTIVIEKTVISYENKLRPCLATNIEPTPKELKKDWVNYLNKNYGVKLNGIGMFSDDDLLKIEDVTAIAISDKRFNLYTMITKTPEGSSMKVFASHGYDDFIGDEKYPKEFDGLSNILNKFLSEELNHFYTDKNNKLTGDLKAMNDKRVAERKSIENNKSKLYDINKEIAVLQVPKDNTNSADIKDNEKLNKLNTKKTELENENLHSELVIKDLDDSIVTQQSKIDDLKAKHKDLLN